MFLLMAVGLYTSRINLQSLGVENFGVYNVVAGFIVMFGTITGSLGNAISRFIMVELGHGDSQKLKSVFSTAINVQLIMGFIIAILGEAIGLWFLANKMQIPDGSLFSATWVLHISIFQFVIGLLNVPFNAEIVAHEKMGTFAYLSLFEAFMRLLIAFYIYVTPFDKLITFAFLIFANQCLTLSIYAFYCRSHFAECHYSFVFNKELLKEMFGFAGWNFIPNATYVLNNQGTNMLMNIYFGVIVNAARGVANQVNNAVQSFITNFMTAVIPQIMKSYASGDKRYAFSLVCRSAKFSYILMFFLALPILIETELLLDIWLKTPPNYSVAFVRWQLAASLTLVFGNPLFNLMMADGRIKKFQLIMAIFTSCPFIVTWICYALGMPVISAYIIFFLINFILIIIRFFLVNRVTGLPVSDYLGGVVFRMALVSIVACIIPLSLHFLLPYGFSRFIIVGLLSVICSSLSVFFLGLSKGEKDFVQSKISSILCKIKQ